MLKFAVCVIGFFCLLLESGHAGQWKSASFDKEGTEASGGASPALRGGLSSSPSHDVQNANDLLSIQISYPDPVEAPRDYFSPLSIKDEKNISFIISTLANASSVQLLFERRKLEKAGDRVHHVHPMRFLVFVFTHPKLKKDVKKINGTPWRRFTQGMARSLGREAELSNLGKEIVEDFSRQVGVRAEMLEPHITNGQWQLFIETVRKQV